jgi:hypothetical protein
MDLGVSGGRQIDRVARLISHNFAWHENVDGYIMLEP